MQDGNEETPLLYARTKGRKSFQIDAPWVEASKNVEKPRAVPVLVYSIWDVLWPGLKEPNFVKWALWVVWFAVFGGVFWKWLQDDDDGF